MRRLTVDQAAELIDPEAFRRPDDQASPTEIILWKTHSPWKREEARRKARSILERMMESDG